MAALDIAWFDDSKKSGGRPLREPIVAAFEYDHPVILKELTEIRPYAFDRYPALKERLRPVELPDMAAVKTRIAVAIREGRDEDSRRAAYRGAFLRYRHMIEAAEESFAAQRHQEAAALALRVMEGPASLKATIDDLSEFFKKRGKELHVGDDEWAALKRAERLLMDIEDVAPAALAKARAAQTPPPAEISAPPLKL